MRIAVVSLGCPKNQVDADVFCRALIEAGHETVPEMALADVVIINTCGFIQAAQEEAIEQILDACALRKDNPGLRVVVTGCLAERYREQVAAELPEVDAVVGIGSNSELPRIVDELAGGHAGGKPLEFYGSKGGLPLGGARVISTPAHYAWLKIAEGCSNNCSYCAIPAIRGPLRSRPQDSVLAEAEWLAGQGVKELVLVAQDVTAYGNEAGQALLVPLLKRLERVAGIEWIRLLYAYPEKIDGTLLDVMAASEKILPYLDIPIQHCDEGILRSMGRRGDAAAVRRAIELIREKLPKATLRTSLIVGYPGEGEAQFEALCDFVRQVRFDRLGCFAYSPEEGTVAQGLPGQLPEAEKQRRVQIVMGMQEQIMAEKQQAMVGKRLRVLCDGPDEEGLYWLCRGAADAPEIDANVLVPMAASLCQGEFFQVLVNGVDGLDLVASVI